MIYLYHVNNFKYHELRNEIVVGRNSGDIIFPADNKLSGKHFILFLEMTGARPTIQIMDLGSKNKTAINREEIPANQKIPLSPFSLIEVGDQKFLITESNSMSLQEIDEILTKLQSKSLVKLKDFSNVDKVKAEPELPPSLPHAPENIAKKEGLLLQLKMDLDALDSNTKRELEAIENSKSELIKKWKEQKQQMTSQVTELTREIDFLKNEAQKLKEEIQLKKQKIINLKDLEED